MSADTFHNLSELELWQIEQTKQAIAEADLGEFATDIELQKVFSKYEPPAREP